MTKKKKNERVAAALRRITQGFAVFPCVPKGKIPLLKGGNDNIATKNRKKAKKYWKSYPDANIGIATGALSGFFAVDIDGKNGNQSLATLEAQHGKLPQTQTVLTPNSGFHLYFLYPGDGGRVKCTAGKIASGIDIRGDGGHVIGAGSRLENGSYRYKSGYTPAKVKIAKAPRWLLDIVAAPEYVPPIDNSQKPASNELSPPVDERTRRYAASALKQELEILCAAKEGTRNPTLNKAAFAIGQMVGAGWLNEDDVVIALRHTGRQIGLEEEETRKTIASGLTKGKTQPRSLPESTAAAPSSSADKADNSSPGEAQIMVMARQTVSYEETDIGNALRLVNLHKDRLRYCQSLGWLIYDGKRWITDANKQSVMLAQQVPDLIRAEAQLLPDHKKKEVRLQWAHTSEGGNFINRMLDMAIPHAAIASDELDASPMLLNVDNGTINLTTGKLRPHSPGDFITKIAATLFDSEAECPVFKKFLRDVMPAKKVRGFVQRFAGYSLTGKTGEHKLAYCHGTGRNGKGTLVNTLRQMMGSYGMNISPQSIMVSKFGNETRSDLARLNGARFVTASEANYRQRLDEALIKGITGGDPITARFLYKEFFDFVPAFKLWFSANFLLQLNTVDEAIWSRIMLVPFNVVIPEGQRDTELPEKLKAEYPGILAWAVRGCRNWQQNGLCPPAMVTDATAAYRHKTDHTAKFIREACKEVPEATVSKTDLYNWYTSWCDKNGKLAHTKVAFGKILKELGYEGDGDDRKNGKRVWFGLKIDLTYKK